MKNITLYILLILFVSSCQQQNVDKQAEGKKLMETSREWSKSTSSTDAARIVSYWADDAILISPGETLQGKEALRQMVESTSKDSTFTITWEPISAEISESGDMGYLIEDSHMTMADSTGKLVTNHFKSVTIWRKQKDGSWKNVVDIMSPAK
jgi:ketosteroid isomerase-like protein